MGIFAFILTKKAFFKKNNFFSISLFVHTLQIEIKRTTHTVHIITAKFRTIFSIITKLKLKPYDNASAVIVED
jgi:hypothetical protein